VMMLSASSNLVPVKLEIEKKQLDGTLLWLVNVCPSPFPNAGCSVVASAICGSGHLLGASQHPCLDRASLGAPAHPAVAPMLAVQHLPNAILPILANK
jgi:hypothetical protein